MKTTMKKSLSVLLLALFLLFSLTACSGNTAEPATTEQPETTAAQSAEEKATEEATEEETESTTAATGSKVLVVYFSATGTTRGVAKRIAEITSADTYEIKAAQEYTAEDLDWHDSSSRSTEEQNSKSARPEIGSEPLSLDGYTTVYIGYPIWWGEEPRIMDTFVESYDFDGITMIPFCTSSSSGIGRSGKNLEENAKSGTWLDGQRFSANAQDGEIRLWIESLQSGNKKV